MDKTDKLKCSKTFFLTQHQLINLDKILTTIAAENGGALQYSGARRFVATGESHIIPYHCDWKLITGGDDYMICLRPSTNHEQNVFKKLFKVTVHYDEHNNQQVLTAFETYLLNPIPEQFYSMDHLLDFLHGGNQTVICEVAMVAMPAAGRSIQLLFRDWNFRGTVTWNCDPMREDEKSPQAHRIEVKEGQFQYVESNTYSIFEQNGVFAAAGISNLHGVYGNRTYRVMCYADSQHIDVIRNLFDQQFTSILESQVDFHGGKFDGKLQIIRNIEPLSLNDLVVEESLQQTIQHEVFDFFPLSAFYQTAGLPFKRGIIFHGPPGTGKTMIVKIVVSQMKQTVIWVRPEDCQDGEDINKIFNLARIAKPSVLIFEDADFITLDRRMHRSGTVGEMLNQLDGLVKNDEIMVIMTTNQLDVIEKAICDRPGRIDAKIYIGELTREKISELLLRKLQPFKRSFSDFTNLLPHSLKLTGAEAVEMAQLIMRQSLQECSTSIQITEQHVWQALKQIKHNKEKKAAAGFN